MNIIESIKEEVIQASEEYKKEAEDHYDYWNEHIKYVFEEATTLAKKYQADLEIVSLGSLLHDIALIKKVGDRKDHHINGKNLANEILEKYNYPSNKKEKVLGCVLHHRSSKLAENKEELCVADADILAHFDNIPMLFYSAIKRNNIPLNEVRDWMREVFEKDNDDLSNETKKDFYEKYQNIVKTIIN